MGVSAAQGSAGLKPGVCTSTTRPSNPFEGQMIYETDTDLTYIYSGAAWQQIAGGTAVGNSGLVYVGQTTSGATDSTVTLDNIFSSTYNAYKIVVSGGSSSGYLVITLQLLDSAGAPITSGYYETFIYSAYSGSTALVGNASNASRFERLGGTMGANAAYGSCELINPYLATPTIYYNSPRADIAGGNAGQSIGHQSTAASCRGIKITTGAGTVNGIKVTAYGYRLG